jgi:triacylglycerol lipase
MAARIFPDSEIFRWIADSEISSKLPRMPRFTHLRDSVQMLIPPLPLDRPRWRDHGGPPVVLLHGLWRGFHSMEPMARTLGREGFSTLNLPYPSFRRPIPELVKLVDQEVARIADDRPVHFVTHSLGGILARALMAGPLSWCFGRLVMLAPPNRGSEIVDWSRDHPLLQRLLGPAGRSLGTDGLPPTLPELPGTAEVAVIMGRRGTIPFFKHLLDSDNDGIVSAAKGDIPGLQGFTVIDADHTFIQMHPEALRLSTEFLKTGSWGQTGSTIRAEPTTD